jgi:uncharacterized protein (TIGR03437 family)
VTLSGASDTQAPTTPSALSASAASSTQINLSWTASTDNVGVAGYRVERCQGAGCTSFAQIATPATATFNDTGLTANTSYSYRVRAADGAANLSGYSNSATATTPPAGSINVLSYAFSEGTGTTVTDLSGKGHTGTISAGIAWTTLGKYGNAISLNAITGQKVTVANPSTLNFGTSDFTISAWVKRSLLGLTQRHIVSKCNGSTWVTGCKEFYFGSDNTLRFGSYAAGSLTGPVVNDTNWHHVAVTFVDSTNQLKLYVDGVNTTTGTKALEADDASHVVTLGSQSLLNLFSGSIDEVRVYASARSLAEIQADMNTPISAAVAPPVVSISSLSCTPSTLNAPGTASCAITLTGAAPSGGASVALTSNNASLSVPVSATITAGATTGSFTATAGTIATNQAAVVTASYGGVSKTSSLSLTSAPAQISALSCTPASLGSGQATTCTVTLSKGAPAGSAFVAISDNNSKLTVPASVSVAASATTASFTATAGTISSAQTAVITASYGGASKTSSISLTTSPTGPSSVLSYAFNEGAGTTVADLSGNGHTGTITTGIAWTTLGKYGKALSFSGATGQQVTVANPSTLNFGTSDFTISAWVKRSALGSAQRHIFSKCATSWATGCKEFYFGSDNILRFGSYAAGSLTGPVVNDTNWHNVAVTFVNSTDQIKFYVDGVNTTTGTKALEADNASHIVTVGNQSSTNPFSGLIDEVRVYAAALSLAEIQADMNTPVGSATQVKNTSMGGTILSDQTGTVTASMNGSSKAATISLTPAATVLSIWPSTAVPAISEATDTAAVDVGVKFRSTVAGYVTGVRFYKGAQNTGTHTGSLWSSSGALLARVNFKNESASGWQQALFSTAVSINANTTYVVSYHAPKGRYSQNTGYFAGSGVANDTLRALKDGEDGGNGVYQYGTASKFPNATSQSSNYWVDVVFTTQQPVLLSDAPAGRELPVAPISAGRNASDQLIASGDVSAPALSCSPRIVQAGDSFTCALRLDGNRSAKTSVMTVAASGTDARLPAHIAARAGQRSVEFHGSIDKAASQSLVLITIGEGEAQAQDQITVLPAGVAVFTLPDVLYVRAGEPIAFTVGARDGGELPVSLSASDLPLRATFEAASRHFAWTPSSGQEGEYALTFTAVNQAGVSSTGKTRIVVASGKPQVTGPAGLSCAAGSIATLQGRWLSVTDELLSDQSGSSLELGGTTVRANGNPVSILAVSPTRVDFLCPNSLNGQEMNLILETAMGVSAPLPVVLAEAKPTLLSVEGSQTEGFITMAGTDRLTVIRDVRGAGEPAQVEDLVVVRATGFGTSAPEIASMVMKIRNIEARIESVSADPAAAGVVQIFIRVPVAVGSGDAIPVQMILRSPTGQTLTSNTVTMAIE